MEATSNQSLMVKSRAFFQLIGSFASWRPALQLSKTKLVTPQCWHIQPGLRQRRCQQLKQSRNLWRFSKACRPKPRLPVPRRAASRKQGGGKPSCFAAYPQSNDNEMTPCEHAGGALSMYVFHVNKCVCVCVSLCVCLCQSVSVCGCVRVYGSRS